MVVQVQILLGALVFFIFNITFMVSEVREDMGTHVYLLLL